MYARSRFSHRKHAESPTKIVFYIAGKDVRMGIIARILFFAAAVPLLAQVTPDPKLRSNRNTYNPVVDILRSKMGAISDEQLEHLKRLQLEPIWQAVQALGYTNCHFSGMHSTRPHERLVGRA